MARPAGCGLPRPSDRRKERSAGHHQVRARPGRDLAASPGHGVPGSGAVVAHLLWEQEVAGSNPVSPTTSPAPRCPLNRSLQPPTQRAVRQMSISPTGRRSPRLAARRAANRRAADAPGDPLAARGAQGPTGASGEPGRTGPRGRRRHGADPPRHRRVRRRPSAVTSAGPEPTDESPDAGSSKAGAARVRQRVEGRQRVKGRQRPSPAAPEPGGARARRRPQPAAPAASGAQSVSPSACRQSRPCGRGSARSGGAWPVCRWPCGAGPGRRGPGGGT
jgi:hypothetical protein